MNLSTSKLPEIIEAIDQIITANAQEVTALDQQIGDGDHVYNLQRGIEALQKQKVELSQQDWAGAWQKIGMTVMSKIGGASGSLYGTFFVTMSKSARDQPLQFPVFAQAFADGVDSIRKRGRSDVGEKTMLDVLVPVADCLQKSVAEKIAITEVLNNVNSVAEAGVEATRDMLASKGRAAFLGERSKGHIDAGAKTAQLMIAAVITVIARHLAA